MESMDRGRPLRLAATRLILQITSRTLESSRGDSFIYQQSTALECLHTLILVKG